MEKLDAGHSFDYFNPKGDQHLISPQIYLP